jgi:hypothetical protein
LDGYMDDPFLVDVLVKEPPISDGTEGSAAFHLACAGMSPHGATDHWVVAFQGFYVGPSEGLHPAPGSVIEVRFEPNPTTFGAGPAGIAWGAVEYDTMLRLVGLEEPLAGEP